MSDLAAGALGLLVLGVILGTLLLGLFWVLVLRLGIGPLREELSRLTDEVRTQNEISLDDELRAAAN